MTNAQRDAGDFAAGIRHLAFNADCAQNMRALMRFAGELDRRSERRGAGQGRTAEAIREMVAARGR